MLSRLTILTILETRQIAQSTFIQKPKGLARSEGCHFVYISFFANQFLMYVHNTIGGVSKLSSKGKCLFVDIDIVIYNVRR